MSHKPHNGPYDIAQLQLRCDADLSGNLNNNHSQTSYLGYLGGALIYWTSTDQALQRYPHVNQS
jgi:hypothetical protein